MKSKTKHIQTKIIKKRAKDLSHIKNNCFVYFEIEKRIKEKEIINLLVKVKKNNLQLTNFFIKRGGKVYFLVD